MPEHFVPEGKYQSFQVDAAFTVKIENGVALYFNRLEPEPVAGKPIPVVEALRNTAALLQEHGHVKRAMYTPEGYCALGGLNKTYTGEPCAPQTCATGEWANAIIAFGTFLSGRKQTLEDACRTIVKHNDNTSRDMAQAMLQCANELECYTLPAKFRPTPPKPTVFDEPAEGGFVLFSEPALTGPSELPPPPTKEREKVMV